MDHEQIKDIVKSIIVKIKEAKEPILKFEIQSDIQFGISRIVLQMLIDRGYVAYVLLDGGLTCTNKPDKLYIDLTRKRNMK